MLNGSWTRFLTALARLLPHLLAFFRKLRKKTPDIPDPPKPSDSHTPDRDNHK